MRTSELRRKRKAVKYQGDEERRQKERHFVNSSSTRIGSRMEDALSDYRHLSVFKDHCSQRYNGLA